MSWSKFATIAEADAARLGNSSAAEFAVEQRLSNASCQELITIKGVSWVTTPRFLPHKVSKWLITARSVKKSLLVLYTATHSPHTRELMLRATARRMTPTTVVLTTQADLPLFKRFARLIMPPLCLIWVVVLVGISIATIMPNQWSGSISRDRCW